MANRRRWAWWVKVYRERLGFRFGAAGVKFEVLVSAAEVMLTIRPLTFSN